MNGVVCDCEFRCTSSSLAVAWSVVHTSDLLPRPMWDCGRNMRCLGLVLVCLRSLRLGSAKALSNMDDAPIGICVLSGLNVI